jgi:hypothetical protein
MEKRRRRILERNINEEESSNGFKLLTFKMPTWVRVGYMDP